MLAIPHAMRGRRRMWPKDGASWKTRTGLLPSWIRTYDDEASPLVNGEGSDDLTLVEVGHIGTTDFAAEREGRRGVFTSQTGQALENAGFAGPGLNSAIMTCVMTSTNTGAQRMVMTWRGSTATNTGSIQFRVFTSGVAYILVADDAGNLVGFTHTTVADGLTRMLSIQIDRAANLVRLRITRPDAVASATSRSIATLGAIGPSGADPRLGAQGLSSVLNSDGVWLGGAAWITGAQCEGANVLENMHKAIGWE